MGGPFSSEKSEILGLCTILNLSKKKKRKKVLTSQGTAGLVNSAGFGHVPALHVSMSKPTTPPYRNLRVAFSPSDKLPRILKKLFHPL